MEDYKKFKGVESIGTSLLSERLLKSTEMYLDWSLLGIGGFVNVDNPTNTISSGNPNKLVAVDDPALTNYQVWQTSKKEWVYETNSNFTAATPNSVVVKVDGTTYAASHPTYGYYIDYPLGRIVFNTALTSTRVVTAQYTYRWAAVTQAYEAPWFRELQQYSFNPEKQQFTQTNKGEWSILGVNRIQMPHIIIEQVPVGTAVPWELGSGNLKMIRNIFFYVFGETSWERDKLIDILSYQQSKTYYLLDIDSIAQNGDYPLDYKGSLVASPKNYGELVDEYGWKQCYVTNHKISELQCKGIYSAIVRWTVEIVGVDT